MIKNIMIKKSNIISDAVINVRRKCWKHFSQTSQNIMWKLSVILGTMIVCGFVKSMKNTRSYHLICMKKGGVMARFAESQSQLVIGARKRSMRLRGELVLSLDRVLPKDIY